VRVRLDPVEGSEQAGNRPALVLSPDVINQHSPVILIASITSQKTERVFPFEAVVEPPEGGLTRRSKVLLMQIRSVDKRRISSRLGSVTSESLSRIEKALRVATGMETM
jgi:mRNA interferase MazF